MVSIIGVVVAVFLLIHVSNLASRVSKLEKRLEQVSALAVPQSPGASLSSTALPAVPPALSEITKTDTIVTSAQQDQVVEWLKNNWLSKLGVLLVLIGFGWFMSYAFVHNWIGPVGRIALGFGLGSVLAVLGAWRIGKYAVQANVLLVLGSAAVLLTAYAARVVYDFFTPEVVLMLAFLVAAYITTLSAIYNREKLAVYGALVALAAPLLTHAPEPSAVGLFVYLTVVSVASIWVSIAKGWGSVNFAAILGVLLYCVPFILGTSGDVLQAEKAIVFMMTQVLALLFFAVNVFQILKHGDADVKSAAYIAIANATLIFSVTNTLVVEEMRSVLLAGWMVIFAIGSAFVSARIRQQIFFYIYALIAIFFLGVATVIELSGPVLTVALSIEAALITILTYLATKDIVKSAYMSLLMGLPVLIALPSLNPSLWRGSVFHDHSVVILLVALLLILIGRFLMRHYQKGVHSENVRALYLLHTWAGAVFAFAFIWLASHAVFPENAAIILSLTAYTVIGIGAYLIGTFYEKKMLKYFGATALIFVIARLLIVDVWQMPLGPRIIVFIVTGVLLVSTAFIGRKKQVSVPSVSSVKRVDYGPE